MGTSIGPAFTYLLGGTNVVTGLTLPATLAAVDPLATVADGWPTDRQNSVLVVGRSGPSGETNATSGTQALTVLGAGRIDETYEIPCYIQTFVGGTNQAEARNAALALWDAFIHFLATDRTLGGALGSLWADISHINIDATPEENLGQGRFCLITFGIQCRNYVTNP